MKKISFRLYIPVMISLVVACAKDKGNYTYHEINRVNISNFDTLNGYQALFGQVLSITPELKMTMDPNPDNYTYEWSLRLPGVQGVNGKPARDSVLSNEKSFNKKVELTPGSYVLQYKVTDKTTNMRFQIRANLNVTTEVYEGFLILSDVNNQSRLDMLSVKKNATDSLVQYTDVLAKMGSTLPMTGKPYQVNCMLWTRSNIDPQNYGIFILNGSGTNRINQETFAWNPTLNIRYSMLGNVPADFAPERISGKFSGNITISYLLYANGNMYTYSTNGGYIFKYEPVNIYNVNSSPFRASKYAVTNGNQAMIYDETNRNFALLTTYANSFVTAVAPSFNYPTGYDLLYMERDYNNVVCAILQDPVTSKRYVLRVRLNAAFNANLGDYFKEITGTDIAGATSFAMSPELGYLFYSVGGKVYEYDASLNSSILMVDRGAEIVSYLDFQFFYNALGAKANPNYRSWRNWLVVGSYNPAGPADNNGTLKLFSVPPVNGQLAEKISFSGFGKIVSVSYREREVW